ncbi:MAG: hypothetical protein NXI18_12170 [Alphaproteobacteria bacterium]|nr:hypothetical protein [Alphaproteobacteria bacterium]
MTDGVLKRLIEACREATSAADPTQAVRDALSMAVARPDGVLAEVPEFEGEDCILHRESAVSVFLVRQTPNTAGPPHDHGMPAVIAMLEGVEIHRHFRRDGDEIVLEREETVGPGQMLSLGPDDVHAIANPDDTASLGVHVYLGDIVGRERTLWDLRSGAAMAFSVGDYDRMVTSWR